MAKPRNPAGSDPAPPFKSREAVASPGSRSVEAEAAGADATDRGSQAAATLTQDQMKAALDDAFAEQMKALFLGLYTGMTTGLPKPDPKAAADHFSTGLRAACAAYEIARKVIVEIAP